MATPVVIAPQVGDYFHDGRRLVEVMEIDEQGDYLVEDAHSELTLRLPVSELTNPGVWKKVERGSA